MKSRITNKDLETARKLLGLPVLTTRKQIVERYRELAKKNHPDTGGSQEEFKKITWAYEVLMEYCNNYIISLKPEENRVEDPESWWFEHFGEDPIWGKREE